MLIFWIFTLSPGNWGKDISHYKISKQQIWQIKLVSTDTKEMLYSGKHHSAKGVMLYVSTVAKYKGHLVLIIITH